MTTTAGLILDAKNVLTTTLKSYILYLSNKYGYYEKHAERGE